MTVSHALTDKVEMLLNNDCLDEAEEIIMPLVERYPDNYNVWHKLGALQMKRGNWDYAVQSLTKAQEIFPSCEPVWYALAFCLNELSHPDRAVQAIRQLLVINPRHTQAMMSAGEMCVRMGKYWDGYQFYEKYLQILPHKRKEMLLQLMMVLQYAEQERQDDISVKLELATLLEEVGHMEQAKEVWIRAKNVFPAAYLKYCPNDAMALMNVVAQNMTVCIWHEWESNRSRLINLVMQEGQCCEPSSFNLIGTTQEEQYVNACRFTNWKYPDRIGRRAHKFDKARVRIGYISSDFHEHATSYLVPGLFMHHDRARFEVYVYSTGIEDHSPARQRIKDSADVFRDLKGLTHDQAKVCITGDGIDILVDLKGWTTGNCNDLIQCRPAPVIVSYLGYPSTTGGLCDYIIADTTVIPEENQRFFSETVVYMQGCYQINTAEAEKLPEVTREMYGLPSNATVYACFNQAYKITPQVFSHWITLLKFDQTAVLWVLKMVDEQIENLKCELSIAGIDPQRLIAMKFCNRAEHLARMKLADVYLETSPVGGHTTLSDWLKMGGGKVNFQGTLHKTFVTLASESIYHHRHTLFDTEATVRNFEKALETIIKDAR